MYKKDGSPDLRYNANRRGSSGSLSGFELDIVNSWYKDSNEKAYLLQDFRRELLQVEPNLIKTLFKLITDELWYNEGSYMSNWPDLEWLAKETPKVKRVKLSGGIIEEGPDSFEKQIEKLEEEDFFSPKYSVVESLIKSYLDNDLEPFIYGPNTFDKNIKIIERIVANALLVEEKILKRNEEVLARQKEKEEKRLVKWISEYGYCTRNRKYESISESFFPLTKYELSKAKRKIIDENKFYDLYQGIDWLDGVDYNAKQIIRLKHLTKKEILYVKENFVLLEDTNVCDLEIQRRSELKFRRKLYELIFIRI